MRSLYSLIIAGVIAMFLTQTIHAEGFFKWKDARGNIQYGDQPPANTKVEKFKMPQITVLDGYGKQWQPLDEASNNNNPQKVIKNVKERNNESTIYTKFKFVAPRANQIIKGGFQGEVSAMLSLKPPLKGGHKITFLLDGKEVSRSTSRTSNFSDLAGGKHNLVAQILDKSGNVLKTSSAVSFNVIRSFANKKRHDKKQEDAKEFN